VIKFGVIGAYADEDCCETFRKKKNEIRLSFSSVREARPMPPASFPVGVEAHKYTSLDEIPPRLKAFQFSSTHEIIHRTVTSFLSYLDSHL
jgi:hypothetical protein